MSFDDFALLLGCALVAFCWDDENLVTASKLLGLI